RLLPLGAAARPRSSPARASPRSRRRPRWPPAPTSNLVPMAAGSGQTSTTPSRPDGRTVAHRSGRLHYRSGVLALFARFLRFGLLAWGGPVAQIAMLRKEL